MSQRNINLKTVVRAIKNNVATLSIGGTVPAGMKRWVTFIMCDSMSAVKRMSTFGLHLASTISAKPTTASVVAATYRKLNVDCFGTSMSRSNLLRPLMFPPSGPDPDLPLFSIAGGKNLGVTASTTTVNLFVQYFDE
ncbi:hypothetical protein KKH23_05495 [Patescibacteria group bacterium]|nr:hypothetical protein [Patescibacteria group bacterium]